MGSFEKKIRTLVPSPVREESQPDDQMLVMQTDKAHGSPASWGVPGWSKFHSSLCLQMR